MLYCKRMDYTTNKTYLTLDGHVELDKYKYVYFIITLMVYLMILCCNCVVIYVICTNKCLHEPMYIFIAALLCNSIFGTTALYPKLLNDFLSETRVVSFEACTFQSFFIFTCGTSEFTLLSAMAYDRYVSICKPLQYATLVKMSTVKKILFFCWFLPSCENSVNLILMYQIKLCKYKLNKIYCTNYAVVRLSCGDVSVRNIYGLVVFTIAVFPPVIFVIYSYIRILEVSLRNPQQFRRKALRTCLPHLFVFINYTVTISVDVIIGRLETNMPQIISIILSVINLVIPPLFNPIVYGLKMKDILKRIKQIIWHKAIFSPL
ncbi:olfactory receptor 13C7-like [Brachyhypopomus gauderio]|uniref:olfactory receptor 13C7-like n=1 Tax=Brachyhypopomus gauderio TaxID=698409 RepID=UPI004041CF04